MNYIFAVTLFAHTVLLISGDPFSWHDCGPTDKYIRYNSVSFTPYPALWPGSVKVGMDIDVLKDLPADHLGLNLTMEKVLPTRMLVPCINGIGTCSYNFCTDTISQFGQLFTQFGSNKCPLLAGKYANSAADVELPKFDTLFASILEGDFQGNATFYNTATNQIYGCLNMHIAIHLKSTK